MTSCQYSKQGDPMPIRPSLHTEHNILHRILSGTWPEGTSLPPERELAESLGVTRPTLRETLKLLERQGWITIRHGRSSVVNDFWKSGGMGILSTLARYTEFIPLSLITELLELRMEILPPCARLAAIHHPEPVAALLTPDQLPGEDPRIFSEFDWHLQETMILAAGRRVPLLMYNDFKALFINGGTLYFQTSETRRESMEYYEALPELLFTDPDAVEKIAAEAMKKSLAYWQSLFPGASDTEKPTTKTEEP